jgi:hypothetical protein
MKDQVKYAVIGRWEEVDGTEEWDVLHEGPLTYEEALKIAELASKAWDEREEGKGILHREVIISCEKLQNMIEEYNNQNR